MTVLHTAAMETIVYISTTGDKLQYVCEYTELDEYGERVLREEVKARLYDDENIDYELSQIVGDIVYKCWDYLF
jgi:hypothetical protein